MIRRPPRSTLLEGRRQRQMCIRDRFYSIGTKAGGKGVICAHSGTVLGLIVSIEDDISSIKKEMDKIASITYLDSVTVTNEGMQIRKGNIDDFIAK